MLELRPYQKDDVNKLKKYNAVAILNQQRTGKTPTSLILTSEKQCKKVLIVCPGSMLYKWKSEFENWLQRPCIALEGTPKQREKKLTQWTDGLTITYDTLKLINRIDKDTGKLKKTGELIHILKQKPDCIIVDEFHRARNRKTLTAKALYKLSPKVPIKIALTGTPAYSKQPDIYSLLHFLYPDKIHNYYNFITEYFTMKAKWTPRGMIQEPDKLSPEGEKKLRIILDKIATQRKQKDPDVMPWLPDKPIPEIIKLPLSEKQAQLLNDLETFYEADTIITQGALDRLIRYRQICIDASILLPLAEHSPKTKWLQEYWKDYIDTPTIYWTNSTKYLHFLSKYMPDSSALITGNTTKLERMLITSDFQNKKIKHLFINIAAGQEGLTLDTAETMIFIDEYPPIGAIEQAIERFTATTPEKAEIPKRVIKLIMDKSYEEDIELALQERLSATDVLNNFKKRFSSV